MRNWLYLDRPIRGRWSSYLSLVTWRHPVFNTSKGNAKLLSRGVVIISLHFLECAAMWSCDASLYVSLLIYAEHLGHYSLITQHLILVRCYLRSWLCSWNGGQRKIPVAGRSSRWSERVVCRRWPVWNSETSKWVNAVKLGQPWQ